MADKIELIKFRLRDGGEGFGTDDIRYLIERLATAEADNAALSDAANEFLYWSVHHQTEHEIEDEGDKFEEAKNSLLLIVKQSHPGTALTQRLKGWRKYYERRRETLSIGMVKVRQIISTAIYWRESSRR